MPGVSHLTAATPRSVRFARQRVTVGAGDCCPQLGQAECYTYSRVPGGAHDVTAAAALPRRRVSDTVTFKGLRKYSQGAMTDRPLCPTSNNTCAIATGHWRWLDRAACRGSSDSRQKQTRAATCTRSMLTCKGRSSAWFPPRTPNLSSEGTVGHANSGTGGQYPREAVEAAPRWALPIDHRGIASLPRRLWQDPLPDASTAGVHR